MDRIKKLLAAIDRFQQGRAGLAVAVGTYKKFSDDQAGNLAALIAYYAFASIFPLLLVFVTVLNIVLKHHPAEYQHLLKQATAQFPGIGPSLIKPMNKAGVALVIGIVLTFYGARGVANAMQNALNSVWGIPLARRPGFPWQTLRSFGLIGVIGPGVLVTITLSGVAGGVGHVGGVFGKIAAAVVALILNAGLFWVGFRLATSREVSWRQLRLSAILSAIVWQILQLVGGVLIKHLTGSNSAYGIFGVVLGLLAWFYLQAQVTLYLVELNVVRARQLWPRSLFPPPLTDADKQAYAMYAEASARRKDVEVAVQVSPPGDPDGPVRLGADLSATDPPPPPPPEPEPEPEPAKRRRRWLPRLRRRGRH
jgi:membrane protein